MTFFLIVPSVMVVSAFLVHAIINRLGLRIHYVTLVMCSFLAIAADLGAIAFSDVPNKFYFIRLAGFVFVAALMTTATNVFLVKRELEEEERFSEQVKRAYQKETERTLPINEISEIEEVQEKIVEPTVEIEEVKLTPKIEINPTKKIDLVKPEKAESETKPEIKPIEKVEVTTIPKVETPAKPEPIKNLEVEKVAEKEKVEPVLLATPEVKGETLDDILDYAYSEKQQGHIWQAIAAYKKALEKYRNDSYAPFVAIDLGNIYKEQAFYTKAIKTYEDALELPAVRRSASTKAEFKKNLIYLKTVQSVLLRHKALSTPFSKISRAYLQEIESEFQTMQLKFED